MSNQNFSSHPISVISSFSSFRPSQFIKPNHDRAQFADVFEEITNTLNQFDSLTKFSITAFNLDDDENITQISENARKSLIRTFLSPEFSEKHNSEIRKLKSSQILNFIKETIGEDSERKRCQNAIEKLNGSSRNIQSEEKFESFCKRLKIISEDMVGAEDAVKNYFIEKVFRENITSSMRSFLLEQNSANKAIEEVAKVLDKSEKYKKNVNLFQIEPGTSELKMENLTKMVASLAEQNNSLMKLIERKLSDVDLEICKIKTKTKNDDQIERLNTNQPAIKPGSHFNKNWELNAAGFPVRCDRCGYRGHTGNNCRGTRASCHICRREGHIAPVCPDRSTIRQSSKN